MISRFSRLSTSTARYPTCSYTYTDRVQRYLLKISRRNHRLLLTLSFSTTTTTTSASSTYYDSQSGLHLPVHNEQEIKLFLNLAVSSKPEIVIPHQLYQSKDYQAYEIKDRLENLISQRGIHGLILPPLQFPRDGRNLTTLTTLTPPGFLILYYHTDEMAPSQQQQLLHHHETKYNNNNNSLCNSSRVLSLHQSDLLEWLQKRAQDRLHTTLWIQQDHYQNIEAISLANHVASVMDSFSSGGDSNSSGTGGGCDYIWLSGNQDDSDKVVQVCEELIYLDVAGPTIKSRMMVEVWKDDDDNDDDDIVEDVMLAGVNKFVIHDVSQVEQIETMATEQGKRIDKGENR
jgi:hypothetical protein